MRAIFLLLTSLIFVIAAFAAGMALTAYVIAEPEPHRFSHLDTPDLWTSRPVEVDPGQQNYERIGAIPALASLPASGESRRDVAASTGVSAKAEVQSTAANTNSEIDDLSTGAIEPGGQPQPAATDPAHAEWCFGRYRSYRVEDNSYQPYGGGTRQQCQSPWTPMGEDMAAASRASMMDGQSTGDEPYPSEPSPASYAGSYPENQDASMSTAPAGAHEEWCYARYRSYRVEDNSYQPFDGGPRRGCSSPHG